MIRRFLLLVAVGSALLLTGCTSPTSAQREALIKPREGFNFLGIVKFEEGAFAEPTPTAFRVTSDDVMMRENYSGNELSFFWGLLEFSDY